MLSRTNLVLAVALVVVITLTTMSQVDYSRPNIEFLPDMKYTPAWTSFSRNPNFRNERTLQEPVAGTIARGMMPLHYSATKEDAIRAGQELTNPFALSDPTGDVSGEQETGQSQSDLADAQPSADEIAQERRQQSVARGTDVYRVFCSSCHGPTGLGNGTVPLRGFPPPPSLLTGASRQMKDGQLFHILTYGQGSMSSLAGQVTLAQRWDAINYVRSLQQAVPAPPVEGTPPSDAGEGGDQPVDQPGTEPPDNNDPAANAPEPEEGSELESTRSSQAKTDRIGVR